MDENRRYEKATFAAGCIWDIEAAFRHVNGVIDTVAGYTGGTVPDPSYAHVESGTTGHVHAVGLVFDPTLVSYEQLLDLFWDLHDPTQSGGLGDYAGPQYRSMIFFFNNEQERAARASRERVALSGPDETRPILTEILPATKFWPADESHQHFYEKCGQGYSVSRKIWE